MPVSSSNSALSSSVMRSSEGCVGAPVDVVGEDVAVDEASSSIGIGLPGSGGRPSSTWSRIALLILLGDAEQHPDHAHRHLGAEVGDEVEAARPTSGSRLARAVLAHLRLERGHLLRCEDPRQEAAVAVCSGGSSKMIEPGGTRCPALMSSRTRPAEAVTSSSRPGRVRRPRSGSPRRSRASRCSRAAPLRAVAGTPGRGRCRSRSRTGRSRAPGPCRWTS